MYRRVAGEWKNFNYTKPMYRHNLSKHWVDDVNARRHDTIGLEDVWHTKWLPHQKLTFLCSVSEVNALNSWERARRLPSDSQLAFRRKLARGMLHNKLESEVHCPGSPEHTQKCNSGYPAPAHELWTRPKFTGAWDLTTNSWLYVKTNYLKTGCSGCSYNVKSYCSCNNKDTLCTKCWGVHKSAQGSTS